MSVRRNFILLGIAFVLGLTTACNYRAHYQNSLHDYASRNAKDPKMIRVRSHGHTTGNPKQHENKYFEYSSILSNKVASLPGINTAIVFVTDKNAYVGILTDWTATGTKARGGPASREQENGGLTAGVYNMVDGGSKWDNRQVANPYNSYFTQKDYVDLSTELRQVIGDTIRLNHPRVQEVHISANREYVNQSLEFAKAAWRHKSLTPLTSHFNTLVQYTFSHSNKIPIPLYELPTNR